MSMIIHPRPSPLAAAMYTLRDLDADVIVLHGPSGCCFRPARLLEKDGLRVITTALTDEEFIFGAEQKLIKVLRRVDEFFHPKLLGLVGSCASMIIGEDLRKAAREAGVEDKTICCDIHSGFGDNTVGAVIVLKAALEKGLITRHEFNRQKMMLEMATELEKNRGTARYEYLDPTPGDSPLNIAEEIMKKMKSGADIACVLNAKKETVFLYADIVLALNEVARRKSVRVRNLANLDASLGLPRVRSYAAEVLKMFRDRKIEVDHITGGLDEYPLTGIKAREILLKDPPDIAVIAGIPHAVAVEDSIRCVAVTVGSRAVSNLKRLGYTSVIADEDAHAISLGKDKKIQTSIFGQALRSAAE
mgnify:FL=1